MPSCKYSLYREKRDELQSYISMYCGIIMYMKLTTSRKTYGVLLPLPLLDSKRAGKILKINFPAKITSAFKSICAS